MTKARLTAYLLPALAGLIALAACASPAPTSAPTASPAPLPATPTAGPVPTTALAASEFTWSVDIVQNSDGMHSRTSVANLLPGPA